MTLQEGLQQIAAGDLVPIHTLLLDNLCYALERCSGHSGIIIAGAATEYPLVGLLNPILSVRDMLGVLDIYA